MPLSNTFVFMYNISYLLHFDKIIIVFVIIEEIAKQIAIIKILFC